MRHGFSRSMKPDPSLTCDGCILSLGIFRSAALGVSRISSALSRLVEHQP